MFGGPIRRASFLVPALVLVAGMFLLPTGASALSQTDGVESWGANASGQLGNGSMTDSATDVAVSGLTGVRAVAAGDDFALALMQNGTVMAWGDDTDGQLGDGDIGSAYDSDVPVTVSGLSDVSAIAAGGYHALALLKNHTVMAWGDDTDGELGDGDMGSAFDSDVPVTVGHLSGVTAISAGDNFDLTIIPYGTVAAWGDNTYGELGDGSMGSSTDSDTPVQVTTIRNEVRAIAAGGNFAVAVLGDEDVVSWGDDTYGELGDGSMGSAFGSDVPVAVSGLSSITRIAAGEAFALAVNPDGTVEAWGDDTYGELGDGSMGSAFGSDVPVAVSGLGDVSEVRAGGYTGLAMLGNSTVMSWGNNSSGQLGDGNTTNMDVPVEVGDLTGAKSISAGADFAVARVVVRPSSLPSRGQGHATIGVFFTKTIKAASHPTYSAIGESGALPGGVTFTDNGNNTATLSGIPANGTAGTYDLVITADDGFGSAATEDFTLTVRDAPLAPGSHPRHTRS